MRVQEVLETCLYASDLEAAEQFYSTILGLRVISRVEGRHVFFRCGNQVFLVFNPEQTLRTGTDIPPHGARGPGHVAFAVPIAELSTWRGFLQQNGIAIESDITWPGGGHSIYFRDPAGNSIELATAAVWTIDERDVFPG